MWCVCVYGCMFLCVCGCVCLYSECVHIGISKLTADRGRNIFLPCIQTDCSTHNMFCPIQLIISKHDTELYGNSCTFQNIHDTIINCNYVIIIIIFLHGLGPLNVSGFDALPSFPGESTISSSSRFVFEGVFRESGVVHSFNVVDPVLFVFRSHVLYSRDL